MNRQFSTLAAMFVLVSAMLVAVGCSQSPEAKLIGTWALDTEATLEGMSAALSELPEAEAEMVRGAMSEMTMSLTFDETTATMTMGEMVRPASYTVVSAEGDSLTLAMTEDGDEEAEETTLTFSGNDSFSMTVRNDTMVFARQ